MDSKSAFKTPCVVAGNGPSLAEIDYARLPKDFDVFRCNQFYFENSYYLGREVKLAFVNPSVIFEQIYTLRTLEYRGEYDIGGIITSSFGVKQNDRKIIDSKRLFCGAIGGHKYLKKLKKFNEFLHYNEIFLNRRITSGIYMCAVATALGYKKVYLAGIDFYEGKKLYAFDFLTDNLLQIAPAFRSGGRPNCAHGKEMDLESLALLSRLYGVEFYSLCPSSPLSKHLPLASPTGGGMRPESKSADSMRDMLVPDSDSYDKFNTQLPEKRKIYKPGEWEKKTYQKHKIPLKKNLFYRVVMDFFKFPSALASYAKARILLIKWKRTQARYGGGGGGTSRQIAKHMQQAAKNQNKIKTSPSTSNTSSDQSKNQRD